MKATKDLQPTRTARVSVVIPVYNTGKYLLPGLMSLTEQDLLPQELQVIAVDDGSTDGSGVLLDDWAVKHHNVTVLHQPNSGWPGQPRNRGLALSTGTYVFFMDGDDYLAPQALRRMADFADKNGSDVTVIKSRGLDGRWSSNRPWKATVVDADLYDVFKSLAPQKLFRRTFLQEQSLRFPEGMVRLEDGIFMAQAYLKASRVSTLADETYYFLTRREGDANISAGTINPVGYTESIRVIADTVRELCDDPRLADRIVLDLYKRKGLKVFAPDRFLSYSAIRREAWTTAVGELADALVPTTLEAQLPEPFLTRSALARARDVGALVDFCLGQSPQGPLMAPGIARQALNLMGVRGPWRIASTPAVHLDVQARHIGVLPEGLAVEGRARLRGRSPVHLRLELVLRHRGDPDIHVTAVPAVVSRLDADGAQAWRVMLPRDHLAQLPDGRYDLTVRDDHEELENLVHGIAGLEVPAVMRFPHRGRVLVPSVTERGRLVLRLATRRKRS